jgi:hypothetical protein
MTIPMKIRLITLLFFVSSCSSIGTYYKDFRDLKLADGVSSSEAKTIGQYHFVLSDQLNVFKPGSPAILNDRLALEYPEFWFVSFSPRDIDQHFYRYLVVINKKSSEVIWEGIYQPLKIINYNWVFTAREKNQDNRPGILLGS